MIFSVLITCKTHWQSMCLCATAPNVGQELYFFMFVSDNPVRFMTQINVLMLVPPFCRTSIDFCWFPSKMSLSRRTTVCKWCVLI